MGGGDIFRFKQFCVNQSGCGMRISTDAVLLGAWADFSASKRILDVGTGTGILALMAAQRCQDARIDAIEIDKEASAMAQENVGNNRWKDRITIHNCDFLDFDGDEKYDYIITNPPYFQTGERAADNRRAQARHTDSLPFERLFAGCARLLASTGRIGIIAPSEARQNIEFLAGEMNLWLCRRLSVRTTARKEVSRYLWEFANYPCSPAEDEIVLQDGVVRSRQFNELTKDFYIR